MAFWVLRFLQVGGNLGAPKLWSVARKLVGSHPGVALTHDLGCGVSTTLSTAKMTLSCIDFRPIAAIPFPRP